MRVVFRTDASTEIGSGHVMRCLTLAHALKESEADISFICSPLPGNQIDRIHNAGFPVNTLNDSGSDADQSHSILIDTKPDWLIVDHYQLDAYWEHAQRQACDQIMVIDDLADRTHDCDLLLDQTYQRKSDEYRQLVPEHCEILTGTHYALLRAEFAQYREHSLSRRQKGTPQAQALQQILITFGGTDPGNMTGQVLHTLGYYPSLPENCKLVVIMGNQAPHIEYVMKISHDFPYPVDILLNVTNMAELMTQSDLCISASGSTSWEAACLGIPTMMTSIADNQLLALQILSNNKLVLKLDPLNISHSLISQLNIVMKDSGTLLPLLSRRFSQICDGLGAQRVTEHLLKSEQVKYSGSNND